MTEQQLRERWDDAWRALVPDAPIEPPPGVFESVLAGWREPHRAYHDVDHLAACLALAAEHRDLQDRPAEVDLALFFHDAIYATQRFDNEERSAAWAVEALGAAGVPSEIVDRVRRLVLVTEHPSEPETRDEAAVLDIDLAVLGGDPESFDRFQTAVRNEFSWVPSFLYRRQRKRVLRTFLEAPSIYRTEPFRARYEVRARENLTQALRA